MEGKNKFHIAIEKGNRNVKKSVELVVEVHISMIAGYRKRRAAIKDLKLTEYFLRQDRYRVERDYKKDLKLIS